MNIKEIKAAAEASNRIIDPCKMTWETVKAPVKPINALGATETHNTLQEAIDLLDRVNTVFDELTDPSFDRKIGFDAWTHMLRCEMDIALFLRRLRA